tara:strand:- start:4851 stop:5183 length:333 start_codon:yes stop_codon:yes gene_type:complete
MERVYVIFTAVYFVKLLLFCSFGGLNIICAQYLAIGCVLYTDNFDILKIDALVVHILTSCGQVQKQTEFLLDFESIKNTSPYSTRLWSNYKNKSSKILTPFKSNYVHEKN